MFELRLNPTEEYVIIPLRVLEKLVRYALTLCQERCPAERDPEACVYLVKLCKLLGLGKPPCVENEYEDFTIETFRSIVREIERKYGMKIYEFIRRVKLRGPRSLEENTDLLEAEFAVGILQVLSKKLEVYIVRGSDLRIIRSS